MEGEGWRMKDEKRMKEHTVPESRINRAGTRAIQDKKAFTDRM